MSDIKQELYRVADDFASHMRLLEILRSEGEDTGPLEQIIAGYFTTDVTREKIDSVIGYIRYCDEMQAAAMAEVKRLTVLASSWNLQREWLKDTVKGVLEMSGQKRLEGLTAGSLTLRANGGRQAVQITDDSLVPEEFVQYTGTISGQAWAKLTELASNSIITAGTEKEAAADWAYWLGRADVQMERIPHKGRIGEALSKKCGKCGGDGEHRFLDIVKPEVPCQECGGDGLARVPGARLEPRGSSVILK